MSKVQPSLSSGAARVGRAIAASVLLVALAASGPAVAQEPPKPKRPGVGTLPVRKSPTVKPPRPVRPPKTANLPKDDDGNVVRTTGRKAGTVDTGTSKKIEFDPKKFGQDGDAKGAGEDTAKVEDVIEWKTNFEKGIKCKKLPLNAKIRLDFNEISLQDLTKFISCITEQNFLLSAGAKKAGTVSILSPKPVTAYEAYKAFLSALEANGLTIVDNGKFSEIVPANEAKVEGAQIRRGKGAPANDRIVTRLIPLEHVQAEEILPVLDKFKTKNADITVYTPTNTIILTDTGNSIRRLVKLMRELDVPTGKEKIWIRPIQYADAGEIVQILEQLFGGSKSASTPQRRTRRPTRRRTRGRQAQAQAASSVVSGGDSDLEDIEITKMIADERTNSVLFVASQTVYYKVDRLVRKLDVPVAGDGQIHIHYLENADADEISSTLSSLAQGSSSRPRGQAARGNARGGQAGGGGAQAGALFEGEVKITAYKPTNALVIESSRKDYLSIQKVIRQLDIRRKQVYVEAILMEISQNKNRELDLSLSGGALFEIEGEQLPLVFGSGGLPGLTTAASALSNGEAVAGFQGPLIEVPLGTGSDGNTGTLSIPAFSFLLKAIQTTNNVNVLSTPHLLTLDNEEAEIQVGRRQPYRNSTFGGLGGGLGSLAGSLTGAAGGAATSALGGLGGLGALAGLGGLGSQVQYVDIDLKLKVKPTVNAADFVRLEIEQQMDELAGFDFDAPVTTTRRVKNVVVVRDGQPVVIGGLMRDSETESVTKVPILGDIPLLGALFRSTQTTIEKRNLLMVIIPHVIKDPSDLKRIREQRREEARELAKILAERRKDYEGKIDYRKKNGLLQAIHERVEEAKKERELREAIILESSDVDKVGPPETHDVEFDPRDNAPATPEGGR